MPSVQGSEEEGGPEEIAWRHYVRAVAETAMLFALVVIALFIFVRVMHYILPFVIGFVVAALLQPLVRMQRRRGVHLQVATLVALGGPLVVVGGLVGLLVVKSAGEVAGLTVALPRYFDVWNVWVHQVLHDLAGVYGRLPPHVASALQATAESTVGETQTFVQSLLSGFFKGVTGLPDTLFIVGFSILSAYFFLIQRERLLASLKALLPPGWAAKMEIVAADVGAAVTGLLRTQLILIGVTTLICVVGLLVLHVAYAFILGAAIGVTGWFPIVGSGIITIPWAAGALLSGNVYLAVKIVALQAVASGVRHLIEPKIMATSVGLATFPTLFSMYVGFSSVGVFGLIIGPIVYIGLRSLLRARIFMDFLPADRTVRKP
jgi:sporulation integral membrane protein YtvI